MIQVNRPFWFGRESAGAVPRSVGQGCRPAAGVPRGRCQTLTITRTDSGMGWAVEAMTRSPMRWNCRFTISTPTRSPRPRAARSHYLIVIFPEAIPGKTESSRRPQATERHATAKCGAAAEVPDLRRASRHAKGRLAIRRGMQRGDSRRPNKRIVACPATIHRRSTCPHR